MGRILSGARVNKKDEFYTRFCDIEDEIMGHMDYIEQFKGMRILCNCNDRRDSNFYLFFKKYFDILGLQKLIAVSYGKGNAYKIEFDGEWAFEEQLEGDGDFRSEECVALLNEVDIVVTNPPFSLFKDYVNLLVQHTKKFLVIGTVNAISYTSIFEYIKEGRVWSGYCFNKTLLFEVGADYNYDRAATAKINDGKYYGKVPQIAWFTNLDIEKKFEPLVLTKYYKDNEEEYSQYINYNAINCNSVKDIPLDYKGKIGVPISYLGSFCPEQFELVGLGYGELAKQIGMGIIGKEFLDTYYKQGNKGVYSANNVLCAYYDKAGNAKIPYARLIIKRR